MSKYLLHHFLYYFYLLETKQRLTAIPNKLASHPQEDTGNNNPLSFTYYANSRCPTNSDSNTSPTYCEKWSQWSSEKCSSTIHPPPPHVTNIFHMGTHLEDMWSRQKANLRCSKRFKLKLIIKLQMLSNNSWSNLKSTNKALKCTLKMKQAHLHSSRCWRQLLLTHQVCC